MALAALAAVITAAVMILRRAHVERVEHVVSERPLDSMTRDELYELARERDIAGRSKMNKGQLLSALNGGSG
jgi:hypothetical protein